MASQSHTNYAYKAKDWSFHKKSLSFQPLAHLLGDILFALCADQCVAADTLNVFASRRDYHLMCQRITTELAEKTVLFVVAGCSAQQLAAAGKQNMENYTAW